MNLVTTASFFLLVFIGHRIIDAATIGEYTNQTTADEDRESLHTFTPEQERIIEEFRNEYSDLLTDDYLRSKSHLVGLLRAKKWNKEEASKQLRKVLQWRAVNKIDALGEEEPNPETVKLFGWRTESFSRDGCPVTQVDLGDWRVDEYMLSKEFVRDAIHEYRRNIHQLYESSRHATKKLVPKCDQAIILMDNMNFTMKNIAESNALNSMIHGSIVLEIYFSNLYKELIYFNCSEDFHIMLKTLQPYLSYSGKAMTFYNEDEVEQAKKHILSLIDPSELPPRFFGTKV